MLLLAGVLAAHIHAAKTAQGQVVDACMTDGAALMMTLQYGLLAGGAWDDSKRGGNSLNGGLACYRCYTTSCGGYIALGPLEPQFWALLLQAVDLDDDPDFAAQDAPQDKMHARLETLFATKPRLYWESLLTEIDACFAPVLTMEEAPNHPHNTARQTFVNTGGITQPGAAPRFSATPLDTPTHGDAGTLTFEDAKAAWS